MTTFALHRFAGLSVFVATAVMFAASAFGASVTLTPSKDTTIYGNGDADLSNAKGLSIFAGRSGKGRTMRGLMQFSLVGQIPAGSTINSVTLTLAINTPHSNAVTLELRRLQADWGEGTSQAPSGGGGGGAAAAGDATWKARFLGTSTWTTPGGDFATSISGSQVASGTSGDVVFSSAGLTADVQGWLDNPATNFGWLIKAQDELLAAVRFFSREGPVKPSLVITYTAGAAGVAPVVTSANAATFWVGGAGSFAVTATGTPAPTLSIPTGLPTWATFTAANGTLAGTPPNANGSPFVFSLQATNASGTASQSFTLTVRQPHSADSSPVDGAISLTELVRVIELYNVRNNSVRTGRYAVAGTVTVDGFASDPTTANLAAVTLARYHSADVNQDGKIGLTELTRVIELYNARSGSIRTGKYSVQGATEDGFAPGP